MAEEKKELTKARNWCFTSFHRTEDDHFPDWASIYDDHCQGATGIKYLIVQREKAPDTGKLHWQGYIELKGPKTFKQVQEWIGDKKAHMETRKGTAEEASKYCEKEDETYVGPRFKFGNLSEQGKRSDLNVAAAMLLEGKSMREVALAQPGTYIRYSNGLNRFQEIAAPLKKRNMEVWIWTGPPGLGKTTWALWKWPEAYLAIDMKEGWMDGYSGQECIIYDEFTGLTPIRTILGLMDGTLPRLPIKGSFVVCQAKTLVILSNKNWELWYKEDPQYSALARRVNEFCKTKHHYFSIEEEPFIPLEVERALMMSIPDVFPTVMSVVSHMMEKGVAVLPFGGLEEEDEDEDLPLAQYSPYTRAQLEKEDDEEAQEAQEKEW